jgi:hypothetical protein
MQAEKLRQLEEKALREKGAAVNQERPKRDLRPKDRN